MNCAYCDKPIEGVGFICASCNAPEREAPEDSKESESDNSLHSPSIVAKEVIEIDSEPSNPIELKQQSPKPIVSKKEQSPTLKKEEQDFENTSVSSSEKKQEKSSQVWKNYGIHPDLESKMSALLISLLLIFLAGFLFVIMLIVMQSGPRYAAFIVGIVIFILLILPIFIVLDEKQSKRWKHLATWVSDHGKRKCVTYEMKVYQLNDMHGGSSTHAEVKILKFTDDSKEESESTLLSKLPQKYTAIGVIVPNFIPESETNCVDEADFIFESETVKYACILEKNGHRIWLSSTNFRAPK